MGNEMLCLFVFLVSIIILVLLWRKRHCRFRLISLHPLTSPTLPYPPGPRSSLFLGNLLRLPTEHMWLTLMDWGSQYGDVLGLHMGVFGQRIVVLNSFGAVKDLLIKRSGNYSGRPRMVMVTELMGVDWAFVVFQYGERWRRHRKLFHQIFGADVVGKYNITQMQEARRCALGLLIEPRTDLEDQLFSSFITIIMRLIYGINIQGPNDQYYKTAKHVLQAGEEAAIPGRFLVDFLPFLKYVPEWMPGAEFQRKARRTRKLMDAYVWNPYHEAAENLRRDPSAQSVVADYLRDWEGEMSTQDTADMAHVTAIAFSGGADTSIATLRVFFLAMSLFPEAQKKAQAQIDRVIGRERLPTFEDLDELPYVHAVVKEVGRWLPVLPLGVAHQVMRDDEYRGYHIPTGTILLGNTWSILHNEKSYPEPMMFRPERFLCEDGSVNPGVQDPDVAMFGYGRRKCPGRFFATNGALINIATFLAVLDISMDEKEVERFRSDMSPRRLMSPNPISHPVKFKCNIRPRFAGAAELLKQSVNT